MFSLMCAIKTRQYIIDVLGSVRTFMLCLSQGAHVRCKLKLMDTFMSFVWVDISPGFGWMPEIL